MRAAAPPASPDAHLALDVPAEASAAHPRADPGARGARDVSDGVGVGAPSPAGARAWRAAAAFAGGAAAAFVAHEAGHVAANFVQGNRPRLVGLRGFGFVPFFAISPELRCSRTACVRADGRPFAAGPRGKFLIATAGFEVQHLLSEVILTLEPDLRARRAPFSKGVLAFNIGLSLGYAISSMAGIEDSHGDAGSAAQLARLPRPVFASVLLLPALIDAYRFARGPSSWAPWVGRASKAGFAGLVLRF